MRRSHSRPPKRPAGETDRQPDRKPAVGWFFYALMVLSMGTACYQICIRPFESQDRREMERLEEDAKWIERVTEQLKHASQEKEAG